MKLRNIWRNPRLTHLLCATFAIAIGAFYFNINGAPPHYTLVNSASLVVTYLFLFIPNPDQWPRRIIDTIVILIGLILLATKIWGVGLYGAHRWFTLYHFTYEPSMILLPCAVLLFAKQQNSYSTAGIVLIAIATAIQPDRSMAAALCLGIFTLLAVTRNKWIFISSCFATAAFVVTLLTPDNVPPVAFVERVYQSSMASNIAIGILIIISTMLLLLPSFLGLLQGNKENRGIVSVFFSTWLALFVAAALGNYPTPLIGYGCSAIMGYILSAMLLPSNQLIKIPETGSRY